MPHTCDVECMKNGGEHWQWDSTIPIYIGVLPQHSANGSDIKMSLQHDLNLGNRALAYSIVVSTAERLPWSRQQRI